MAASKATESTCRRFVQRWGKSGGVSIPAGDTTSKQINACGYFCAKQRECSGFSADGTACHLHMCVNPYALSHAPQSSHSSIYYVDSSVAVSALLAQAKPSELSSHFPEIDAFGYAEEGNNGIYFAQQDMTHSDLEANPWWRVDLQRDRCIFGVNIFNRVTEDQAVLQRLSHVRITVSKMLRDIFHEDQTCGTHNDSLGSGKTVIACTRPHHGRFVQLELMKTGYLHFAELEVYGY